MGAGLGKMEMAFDRAYRGKLRERGHGAEVGACDLDTVEMPARPVALTFPVHFAAEISELFGDLTISFSVLGILAFDQENRAVHLHWRGAL